MKKISFIDFARRDQVGEQVFVNERDNMSKSAQYSVHSAMDGYWVVDRDSELVACSNFEAARLVAALMNGDVAALAAGSREAADACLEAVLELFRPFRRAGRPMAAVAIPQL